MEGQLIRRSDVPNACQMSMRVLAPKAHLNRSGTLFLSVGAIEALGNQDCRVVVEFDEAALTLKFTAPEKLPQGFSEADTFPMRIRKNAGSRRPIGMISLRALLKFISFRETGNAQDFEILALDAKSRSVKIQLPESCFAAS